MPFTALMPWAKRSMRHVATIVSESLELSARVTTNSIGDAFAPIVRLPLGTRCMPAARSPLEQDQMAQSADASRNEADRTLQSLAAPLCVPTLQMQWVGGLQHGWRSVGRTRERVPVIVRTGSAGT